MLSRDSQADFSLSLRALNSQMMFAFSDFQYACKKGDMFQCQSSLPSLPVPPLKQTLERYLHSVRPLTSKEEFQNTTEAVEEFGKDGGRGEELQRKLLERAAKMENWVNLCMCCTAVLPSV